MSDSEHVLAQMPENKKISDSIVKRIIETFESNKGLEGVLLCEGVETSLDYALYSTVYTNLMVIPFGGCSNVMKETERLRNICEYPVFSIIDRDNRSKKRVKQLVTRGIYTTKLPFVENIVCCPEVLKVISKKYSLDYTAIMKRVKNSLTTILAEKLSFLNPFNVEIPMEKQIQNVRIIISTDDQTVIKNIDVNNVMYTFRGKVILSEVASAMGHSEKGWYSQFIINELCGDSKEKLATVMGKYLPVIKITED